MRTKPPLHAHAPLRGVLPVLYLPFAEDYAVDEEALRREIDWVFAAGADGLVLAMVSEIFRLTDAERDELVERTVAAAAGRGPVVASVGAESACQAVRHLRAACQAGASAVMAIPPVMTRCSAQETERYYETLLNASVLPVIVQDAGGFVGSAIAFDVLVRLFCRHPGRVSFKPEAPPRGQTISCLHEATDGQARIYDGMSGLTLPDHHRRGLAGVMGGAECPWAMVRLWRALEAGREAEVQRIHAPLAALVALMPNLDAFVALGKELLVRQGILASRRMRGPSGYELDPATEAEAARLLGHLRAACEAA